MFMMFVNLCEFLYFLLIFYIICIESGILRFIFRFGIRLSVVENIDMVMVVESVGFCS